MCAARSSPSTQRIIERVGECLDGDHCPRYHCHACGQYWLGNTEHHCGVAFHVEGAASPNDQLRETISRWMEVELKRSPDIAVAARNVIERVKAADLSEALIDAYGHRLVIAIWHQHVDELRTGEGKTSSAAAPPTPVAPVSQQRRGDHSRDTSWTASNGAVSRAAQTQQRRTRRVDVDQLKSDAALLEALFFVDGLWIRLGDLNKRQCRNLQVKHQEMARAFGYLAAGLREGQTVRQRWTVDQIDSVMGETLREAASLRPTRY